MSRIRSVHPGLFTDESFMAASPHARILIIGLWTEADDNGVFEWKPLTLKARLLPVDAVDVGALLEELVSAGVVKQFEADGKTFGAVRNFRKFQRPQKPKYKFPLPSIIASFVGGSSTATELVPYPSPTTPVKSPQMEEEGVGGREPTISQNQGTDREVLVSPRDPYLDENDHPFIAYSETELDALQFEFDSEDIPKAVTELWEWTARKGISKINERKAKVYQALANRRGRAEMLSAKQNAPPVSVSPELVEALKRKSRAA